MSSKTDERAKAILRLLLRDGKTSVEELTRLFATSPASVRRDLVRLEERGLVHRTHGGVMLAGQTYEPFRLMPPSPFVKSGSRPKKSESRWRRSIWYSTTKRWA